MDTSKNLTLLTLGLTLLLPIQPAPAQVSALRLQNVEIAPESTSVPPGRVVSAVAAARKAIQEHPGSAESYLLLGIALRSGGDFGGALDAINRALKLDPHLSGAWLQKGLIANAWLQKGLIANEEGTLEAATRDFQKAVEASPKSIPARLELADMLFGKGDFESAKSQIAVILRLDPDNANALNGIGLLQLQAGRLHHAAADFRKAIAHRSRYPEAQMNLGNALFQLGDWSGAREAYQNALRDQPDDAMATYGLARALRKLGDSAPAQAEFAKAKTLLQKQTDDLRANGENNRGLKLWHAGDLAAAAAAFRSAIAQDSTFADAHDNLGGVLWQQNEKKAAIQEFEAAIHYKPDFAEAHNNLGNALIDSGDVPGAIQEFSAAMTEEPSLATGHFNLGRALGRAGRKTEAEAEFHQAVLLDPGLAAAHLQLGLQMVSDPDQLSPTAKTEIEKGLQLNPQLILAVPEPVLHALAMMDRVIAPEVP